MTMENKQGPGSKTGQTKETELANDRGTAQATQGGPKPGTGAKERPGQMGTEKPAGRTDQQQGDGQK